MNSKKFLAILGVAGVVVRVAAASSSLAYANTSPDQLEQILQSNPTSSDASAAFDILADRGKGGDKSGGNGSDHGKSGDDHGKSGDDHGKAGDDHGKDGDDHGKAGDDHGKGHDADHGKDGDDHGHYEG